MRDAKIRGLILAAGRGSRLGNAGQEVPKCLLEVGRRTLVEHQLDALADAGIGPTALVVGYAADEVREAVDIRADYIVNTRWNRTNSLYSFWLAREWLTGPVVIMNSDVLFSPEVLERLLEVEGDAIAIDTSSGHAREQMAVQVVNGRVVDMRKDLPPDCISGENVGILKLTAETAQEVLREAERLIEAGERQSWMGAAVRAVAARRPLTPVDVSDLAWVEIDFPTDLVRARKEVWPRIRRERRRLHRHRSRAALFFGMVLLALLPFAVHAALFDPPPPAGWETIGLDGARNEHVLLGESNVSWWLFDAEHPVRFTARGPGPIRVDTRLLDPDPEGAPYVIEIGVDGRRVDWFADETRPSGTYTHEKWVVGKRRRATIELGPGSHEIDVHLVAPADARCLLRARFQAEPGDD